jgi:type II secretory ATPase GspE/PulE/Tfp pilus assembly ATPase PilB-like protein
VRFTPAPRAETTPAPTRVTAAPARIVPVKAMNAELTAPLSELVARQGADDFGKIFEDLVRLGASDVHMTRSVLEGTFTVSARVDGKEQVVHTYTGVEATTITTLLKAASKMTSGVNVVPEDGSYDLPIDGYPYRARAVALPLFDGGEHIVFRLPQIGDVRRLDDLGFSDTNLAATQAILEIPGGMTLFAGPTGEGKSMTSLSALTWLKEKEGGVFITLEDPVERVIPGIKQIQVNDRVEGAGFGDQLRYLKRSDPNVLFIGEIRDTATATAAVEIAKSGRRVVATIHANDNVSAFMNLIEMADATPISVLESVNGIISQRLVPRLKAGTSDQFSGRYPIHEVTQNSEELTDALLSNVSRAAIREAAAKTSTFFAQNVEELVASGITTRAEAQKVVRNV